MPWRQEVHHAQTSGGEYYEHNMRWEQYINTMTPGQIQLLPDNLQMRLEYKYKMHVWVGMDKLSNPIIYGYNYSSMF